MITSIEKAAKDVKVWLLLYLVSVCMALPVAVTFMQGVKEKIGNSGELERLVGGFDYITFSDASRMLKETLGDSLLLALALSFVYYVIMLFLNGGIIGRIRDDWKSIQIRVFLKDCRKTFWKFLLLGIYVFLLSFVLFLVCGLLFFILSLLAENGSDRSLVLWLLPGFLSLFFGLTFAVVVGDYARVLLHKNEHIKVSKAFFTAISFVVKRPRTLALFYVLLLVALVILALYLGLTSLIDFIPITILFQQLYTYTRTLLRGLHYTLAWGELEKQPIVFPKNPSVNFDVSEEESEEYGRSNSE